MCSEKKKMTYAEACQEIAMTKPSGWYALGVTLDEIAADTARAKSMSDPATWPENTPSHNTMNNGMRSDENTPPPIKDDWLNAANTRDSAIEHSDPPEAELVFALLEIRKLCWDSVQGIREWEEALREIEILANKTILKWTVDKVRESAGPRCGQCGNVVR